MCTTSSRELNTVFHLVDVAPYNNEHVEFKRLMCGAYGDISVVAMVRGQRLAEHTAPGAVLVLVLEGMLEFVVKGAVRRISAGEAIMMEAGTPHSVLAVENTKFSLTKLVN